MQLNRKLLRAHAAAALVAWSLAIPVSAQTRPATLSATSADLSPISIENFGRVSDAYYRGAQPEGRDYTDLAAFGIKTVIDLQRDGPEEEAGLVETAGMKFYRIPMTTHEPPTADKLDLFLKLVSDPANQPVFVHCAGGKHRTGVMTAAYRMTLHNWTPDEAYKEMKQYRFGSSFFHPEFKEYVFGYPALLERRGNATAAAATSTTGS
jgi:tyrosine-protein phosphatase SIW14